MIRHYEAIALMPDADRRDAIIETIPATMCRLGFTDAGHHDLASRWSKATTCCASGIDQGRRAPTSRRCQDHVAGRRSASVPAVNDSTGPRHLARQSCDGTSPALPDHQSLETGNDLPDLKGSIRTCTLTCRISPRTSSAQMCETVRGERIGFARQRLEVAMCCTIGGNHADDRRP